jgi:hypothetical protein
MISQSDDSGGSVLDFGTITYAHCVNMHNNWLAASNSANTWYAKSRALEVVGTGGAGALISVGDDAGVGALNGGVGEVCHLSWHT